jgi:hypothetical protein
MHWLDELSLYTCAVIAQDATIANEAVYGEGTPGFLCNGCELLICSARCSLYLMKMAMDWKGGTLNAYVPCCLLSCNKTCNSSASSPSQHTRQCDMYSCHRDTWGQINKVASQHRRPSPRRCQFYVADESTLDASALQFVNEEHAVAACSAFYH